MNKQVSVGQSDRKDHVLGREAGTDRFQNVRIKLSSPLPAEPTHDNESAYKKKKKKERKK